MKSFVKIMAVVAVIISLEGCIYGGSTPMNYSGSTSTAYSGGQYSSLMNITKKTTVKLSGSIYSSLQIDLYTDGTCHVQGVYNTGKVAGKSFSGDGEYTIKSGSYHDVYKRWIDILWRASGDRYYTSTYITEDGVVVWGIMTVQDIPNLSDRSKYPDRVISVY